MGSLISSSMLLLSCLCFPVSPPLLFSTNWVQFWILIAILLSLTHRHTFPLIIQILNLFLTLFQVLLSSYYPTAVQKMTPLNWIFATKFLLFTWGSLYFFQCCAFQSFAFLLWLCAAFHSVPLQNFFSELPQQCWVSFENIHGSSQYSGACSTLQRQGKQRRLSTADMDPEQGGCSSLKITKASKCLLKTIINTHQI